MENYDKLLKRMNANLAYSRKLSNITFFLKLTKKEQKEIIVRSRLLLNDISKNVGRFFGDGKHDVFSIYKDAYNDTAKSLRNMGIPIQRIEKKTVAEITQMNRQLATAVSDSIQTSSRLLDMRFEMAKDFRTAIERVNPNAFAPRATLLNFTNHFQDKAGKPVLMREFRQVQRDIISYLRDDVLPNGLTLEQASPKLTGMVDRHFPTGKVAIPVTRKDNTMYNRHIDVGDYAEGWFHDNHSRAHTEGVLSSMSLAGVDLVDIVGGITDNPICDPYVAQKTFSLTGETKGYPVLEKYPPFHVNCSKRMRVSGKNE